MTDFLAMLVYGGGLIGTLQSGLGWMKALAWPVYVAQILTLWLFGLADSGKGEP